MDQVHSRHRQVDLGARLSDEDQDREMEGEAGGASRRTTGSRRGPRAVLRGRGGFEGGARGSRAQHRPRPPVPRPGRPSVSPTPGFTCSVAFLTSF